MVTALGKTGGFDVVNVRVLSGLQRTARPPGPSRKIELKQQNQSRGSMVRLQANNVWRVFPEWIATILVDKDHVTCRRGISTIFVLMHCARLQVLRKHL